MRRAGRVRVRLVLVSALAAVLSAGGLARADEAWIPAANNAFAADLYGKLAATKGGLFFSPNSIETALAMTYAGARGRTAQEMAKVLHLPAQGEQVHRDFGAFLRRLNAEKTPEGKPRGYQLSAANALWGQKGYEFLPGFLDLLKTAYGAGLTEVDFAAHAEEARKTINAWAEKETRDKIKDLVPERVLNPETRLVLTNAIYFRGDWAEKFNKADTKDAPFLLSKDGAVEAPLMNRTGTYDYTEAEAFQALRLPYAGNELAMVILLPRKTDGLADLEKSLTAANLAVWLARLESREVRVSMPRFKVAAQFSLADPLKALGMTDAFAPAADLSGMNGRRDLFISAVVHKAFVEVNEEGTEAAAATAVVVGRESEPPPPVVFRADHPFLFLIREERTGTILFLGRLVSPSV